jgi:hypothetical protein
MLPLALGIAILDEHTRLTYLETDGIPLPLLLAAIGAAACRHYLSSSIIHFLVPKGEGMKIVPAKWILNVVHTTNKCKSDVG